MTSFPEAARIELANPQLRANLRYATDTIRAKRARAARSRGSNSCRSSSPSAYESMSRPMAFFTRSACRASPSPPVPAASEPSPRSRRSYSATILPGSLRS